MTPLPPHPSSTRARISRAGFTLIEVMVATSILLVIVLMIGSIFRQASSFWDTGYARAEGGMVVRSVVGALGRDLATAVDGRRFDKDLGNEPVKISSDSVSFCCYKPATGSTFERDVHRITYSVSGGKEVSRTDEVLSDDGSSFRPKGSPSVIANLDNAEFSFHAAAVPKDAEKESEKMRDYEDETFEKEILWTIPSIKVRLSLKTDNTFSGLEVRSFGRDGVPNEESQKKADDIVVK